MKRFIFFVLFTFLTVINSQPIPRTPIFIEQNVLPGDSLTTLYLSYRIGYSDLIFVKEGNSYNAGVSVMFEASASDSLVDRETSIKSVSTKSYKETESRSKFVEGVVALKVPSGMIDVVPSVSDRNSDRSTRLKPIEVEVPEFNGQSILKSIPVFGDKIQCEEKEYFRVVNYEGVVPFSPREFYLITMIEDVSVNSIKVSVEQNGKQIFNGSFEKIDKQKFSISECGEVVVFGENGDSPINLFLIKGVSRNLAEGPFTVDVTAGSVSKSFEMMVEWANKPLSLRNLDFAMDITERIMNDPEFEKIYSFDSDLYEEKLFEYWKDKDPVKSTQFNELMNEFYLRVDYAIREFSSVNNRNGALTDRGKIYIKFGPPDKIERTYPEQNQIVEIWVYENIGKEFYFKDTAGLGNYTLMD